MSQLLSLLSQLGGHSILKGITLDGVVTFIRLASQLKRSIIQPQPISDSDPENPPLYLPTAISAFLSTSLNIPPEAMEDLWSILKTEVWEMPLMPLIGEDYRLFKEFGWPLRISSAFKFISVRFVRVTNELSAAHTVYPPNYCCNNSNCTNHAPLKKHYFKKAVIYTDNSGVQPSWNISLYCPGM